MVAGKYGYYWECHDGTVSMDLEAIWGMSVEHFSSLKVRTNGDTYLNAPAAR
jgi:hypothetical protein